MTVWDWLVLTPLGLSFALLLAFMTFLWAIAYRMKRIDLVDGAWGGGFVVVTLTAFLFQSPVAPLDSSEPVVDLSPRTIVCLMVIIWGVRLSSHIMQRFVRRDSEDVRYVALRKKWKSHVALNSYVQIFLLQAVLIYIISLPVQIVAMIDPPVDNWLLVGSIVWLIGFYFEAVGDFQLAQFARNPKNKGKLLARGLWAYTRHPNYFGEVTQWWGIAIIAGSLVLFSPLYAALILPSPLLITVLILKISGVPLTEQLMSKRDGWKEYATVTSKFLPLPPKKG